MTEYEEAIATTVYLVGKALDEIPYGAESSIQHAVNAIEEHLKEAHEALYLVLDKLKEMK